MVSVVCNVIQPKTQVINIMKNPNGYDVYIGRPGLGFDGFFGSPCRIGRDGTREETIEKFTKYFRNRINTDEMFRHRVKALRGLRLGCFCSPRLCHGDVIAKYLDTPEAV